MSKIAIAVLTRDNQPNLMVNLSHHAKLLAGTALVDRTPNAFKTPLVAELINFDAPFFALLAAS